MTALPRNILFGSLVMLAALAAASCSSESTGQTLSVTAVPNSPQTVTSNTDHIATPIVTYKGSKDLEFNWSVDLPTGGQVAVTNGATKGATFNFKNPGNYTVILNVQETGGSIAKTSSGTYTVVVNPVSATGSDVIVTMAPLIANSTATTGTLALTIAGGVAPYSVVWTTQNVVVNSVTLSLVGTTQTVTGTSTTKSFSLSVPAATGNRTATFIASGTVTDANSVQSSFQIGITAVLGAPG